MGWFDDVCDTVGGVAEDVGGFVEDTVSGAADAVVGVTGFVADVAAEAVAAATAAAEAAAAAAADTATAVVDAVSDTGDWLGNAIDDVPTAVADATIDAGEWLANTTDDYIFDTVDFITAGVVDIDYDGGDFSANLGIDGVASVGISFGDSGFDFGTEADIGIASGGFGVSDDEGFATSASAGVDWGPLPYAEGHVDVSEDGDVSVGGRAQGTLPTPYGVVTGSAEGDFYRNEDGSWGAHAAGEGTLYTPTGAVIGANANIGYDETADGDSVFTAGAGGSIGTLGGPSVSAGVGYAHSEIDGVTTDSVSGEVGVEGYGFEAGAEGGYSRSEDAQGNVTEQYEGSVTGEGYGFEAGAGGSSTTVTDANGNTVSSQTDSWADVGGFDTDAMLQAADTVLGTEGALTDGFDTFGQAQDVAGAVSNLAGSGDLSDVLGTMADQSDMSVADIAGDLAGSGNFDDFSSAIVESEVSEAVVDDVWDDIGS